MKRIKLTVAYDGTDFSGWQIQPAADTIELQLDRAIYRVSGERLHVTGASRTDAGVHAYGNVAVFDTEASIPPERWAYALNSKLPKTITVMESKEVPVDFHPRHCNTVKTYEYSILNTERPLPQYRNYTWHVDWKLDIEKMREAAKPLIGEHDFKSFCCVRTTVESTVRTIYSIDISEKNEAELKEGFNKRIITIRISGNGFLYNMVRIIAGTLTEAGRGRINPQDVRRMLEAKDRCAAGKTAPPQGLTLMNIDYVDKDDEIN